MADEEWDEVIKTHLYGHFYCTRAAVNVMRDAIKAGTQKNGKIINTIGTNKEATNAKTKTASRY